MKVRENVSLAPLTTFKIGGIARRVVELGSFEDVDRFAAEFTEKKYFCLGGGSNVLFTDEVFRIPVLRLIDELSELQFNGNTVRSAGGAFLPTLAHSAAARSLTGLEWAAGIPGSVGGAIKMNAGAHDKNMLQQVKEIVILDSRGEIITIPADELEGKYRSSGLGDDCLILEAELELQKGSGKEINRRQLENLRRRRLTQPVEVPSAGSIFKNPPGKSAGALIEKAGLKGESAGDARVSEKHANFIVNRGRATARDVLELISRIQNRVRRKFNIELELEICIPGSITVGDLQ